MKKDAEFWDNAEHVENALDALTESLCLDFLECCKKEKLKNKESNQSRDMRKYVIGSESLPQDAVDLGMAVLIACRINPPNGQNCGILHQCAQAAAENGGIDWLEEIPWDLSLNASNKSSHNTSILVENLCHHNSTIRLRLMKYAWLVRDWLIPDTAAMQLFTNLADKLGYLAETAALCYTLYGADDEAFFRAADVFTPETRWDEQFRFRIAKLKDVWFSDGISFFQTTEAIAMHICLSRLKTIPLKKYIFTPAAGQEPGRNMEKTS